MADNNVVLNVGANTGGFSSALTKAIEEMSKELNTSLEKGFGDVGKKLGESLIDAVKQASADAQPELLKIVERLQTETNKITEQKEKQADAAKREFEAQEKIVRLQAALEQQRAEGQSSRTINKTESYISSAKDDLFKAQTELAALNSELKSSEQIIASLGSQIASSGGIENYKAYMEAKLEADRKAHEAQQEQARQDHEDALARLRDEQQAKLKADIETEQKKNELAISRATELQALRAEERESNAVLVQDYTEIREAMSRLDVLSKSSGIEVIKERAALLSELKNRVNEITEANISSIQESAEDVFSMLQGSTGSASDVNTIREASIKLNNEINKQLAYTNDLLSAATKEEQKQADIEAKRAQKSAEDTRNKTAQENLAVAQQYLDKLNELNKTEGTINLKQAETLKRNIESALKQVAPNLTDLSTPIQALYSKINRSAEESIKEAKAHNDAFRASEEAANKAQAEKESADKELERRKNFENAKKDIDNEIALFRAKLTAGKATEEELNSIKQHYANLSTAAQLGEERRVVEGLNSSMYTIEDRYKQFADKSSEEIRRVLAAEQEQISSALNSIASEPYSSVLRSTQNIARQLRTAFSSGDQDAVSVYYAKLVASFESLDKTIANEDKKYKESILQRSVLISDFSKKKEGLEKAIARYESHNNVERAESLKSELRDVELLFSRKLNDLNSEIALREKNIELVTKAQRSAQDELDTIDRASAAEEQRIRDNRNAEIEAQRKIAEEKKKQRAKDQSAILNSIKYIYQQSVTNINNSFNVIKSNLNEAKRLYSGLMNTLGLSELNTNPSGIVSGSLDNASALVESQSLLNQMYSDGAEDLLNWADSQAYAYGIASKSAREYISQISSMLMNLNIDNEELVQSMTKSYTKLAGDLASAFNASSENVYAAIRSAVAGISRPLLRYGINTKIENLEDWVQKHKIKDSEGDLINYRTLSEANKQLVRYAYIMEQTRKIHGDYSETFASFANNVKTLKNEWQNFLDLVGMYAIPIFKPVVEWLLTAIEYAKEFVRVFADIMGLQVYDYAHSGVQVVNDMAESQEDFSDAVDDTNKNLKKGAKLLDLYELDFGDSNKKNSADLADEKELAELLQGLAEDYGDFAPDFKIDVDTQAVEKFANLVKRTLGTVKEVFDKVWNFQIGDISLRSLFEDAAQRLVEDPIGLGIDVFGTIYSVKNVGSSWNSLKEHLALVAQAGGRDNLTRNQRIVESFKGIGTMISSLISLGIAGYDWGSIWYDIANGLDVNDTQVLSAVTNTLSGVLTAAIGGYQIFGVPGALAGAGAGLIITLFSAFLTEASKEKERVTNELRQPIDDFMKSLVDAMHSGNITFAEYFSEELGSFGLTKEQRKNIKDTESTIAHLGDVTKSALEKLTGDVNSNRILDDLSIDNKITTDINDLADALNKLFKEWNSYQSTSLSEVLNDLRYDLGLTDSDIQTMLRSLETLNNEMSDKTVEEYKRIKTREAMGAELTESEIAYLKKVEEDIIGNTDFASALQLDSYIAAMNQLNDSYEATNKTYETAREQVANYRDLIKLSIDTGSDTFTRDEYLAAQAEVEYYDAAMTKLYDEYLNISTKIANKFNEGASAIQITGASYERGFSFLQGITQTAIDTTNELRQANFFGVADIIGLIVSPFTAIPSASDINTKTATISEIKDVLKQAEPVYAEMTDIINSAIQDASEITNNDYQRLKNSLGIEENTAQTYVDGIARLNELFSAADLSVSLDKSFDNLSEIQKRYVAMQSVAKIAEKYPLDFSSLLSVDNNTITLDIRELLKGSTVNAKDYLDALKQEFIKEGAAEKNIFVDDSGIIRVTMGVDAPNIQDTGKEVSKMYTALAKLVSSNTEALKEERKKTFSGTEEEWKEIEESLDNEASNLVNEFFGALQSNGYFKFNDTYYMYQRESGRLVSGTLQNILMEVNKSSLPSNIGTAIANGASSSMKSELLSGLPSTKEAIESFYEENPVKVTGELAVDFNSYAFDYMLKINSDELMQQLDSIRHYVDQNPLEISLELAQSSDTLLGNYLRSDTEGTASSGYDPTRPLDVNVYIGNREINDYIVDAVEQANRERG